MKNLRRILLSALFVLAAVVMVNVHPVQAEAATVKEGLVKVANTDTSTKKAYPYYYYFYENGVKIKSKWRTVDGYKYYFTSTGKAYCAPKVVNGVSYKYNVIFRAIGDYKYCFDNQARMMTSGYYMNAETENIFYVYKSGHYSYEKTMAIRKTIGYLKNASALRTILGNPSKIEDSDTCMPDPKYDGSLIIVKDRLLYYKHFIVSCGVSKKGNEYQWGIICR